MSQASLATPSATDTPMEELLESAQWMAAVEATVFAVALLKQKLDAGERAAELESHAHAEFRRALTALQDDHGEDR